MKTIHHTNAASLGRPGSRLPGRRMPDWRILLVSLLASVMLQAGHLAMSGAAGGARAENLVSLNAAQRMSAIKVALGKSEDVRTEYGVGLAFTPTVLSGGQINLKIEPEVSQIDTTCTVSVSTGITVPALTVRRASTTIELRDGQSVAIGSLLQNNGNKNIQQSPLIGDVPVLGALFRSASHQKKETDLAIIVTPRLAQPSRPGDVVRTPFDNTLPADDPDLSLLGKTETPHKELRKNETSGENDFVGHILDLPTGVRYVLVQ